MQMRTTFLGGLALTLTFLAVGYSFFANQSNTTEIVKTDALPATPVMAPTELPTTPITPAPSATENEMLRNISVVPNSKIGSPITVTGEARGMWYFEASFPILLVDANNVTLVQTHAEATADWMTDDFVPFTATLTWASTSTTATSGILILKRDNPSGLPENDASIEIPVTFQ